MEYIKPGSEDQHLTAYLQDAVSGGAYVTDDPTNINLSYIREGDASATTANATSGTLGTHGDNTARPFGTTGLWQIDYPDAAFAAAVNFVDLLITHDTGLFVPKVVHVDLSVYEVNTIQISGDITAADNLESVLDGTGATLTADITGSLSGSVASVAGNVDGSTASVTGAVGSVAGNVDGSVASVTGAVGSVAGNVDGSVASVTGSVGSVTGGATEAKQDAQDVVLAAIATDTTTDIPALIATAQADLDTITGADGVILLTATQASIDAIEAKTDTIGAATVTYTSPAAEDGEFVIIAGDDYLAADSRALTMTVSDYAGPSLAAATATFRVLEIADFASTVEAADLETSATLSVDGTTVSISIDLTDEQTIALSSSPPDTFKNHSFRIVATTAGGSVVTLATGRLTVKKGIA